MKEQFLSWGMLIVSVVFNAGGVFIIKMRLNELGEMKLESFKGVVSYLILLCKSPLVLSGIFIFFLAPFFFAFALSRMDITIAYPAQIGLNFLILIALAVFFLGESFTVNRIIGAVLILASIYFLHK